jgi:hypothetical protein
MFVLTTNGDRIRDHISVEQRKGAGNGKAGEDGKAGKAGDALPPFLPLFIPRTA